MRSVLQGGACLSKNQRDLRRASLRSPRQARVGFELSWNGGGSRNRAVYALFPEQILAPNR